MDPTGFADADADLDAAEFAILGAPYEHTVSFKGGTRDGPGAIREATWNFETYHLRNGADLALARVHDAGDIAVDGLAPAKMRKAVKDGVSAILDAGPVPILLGGEHSVTVGAVDAVREHHDDLVVIALDAHLDYRDAYEGEPMSHACVARRLADDLPPEHLAWIGVRSACSEEWRAARMDGVNVANAFEVHQAGMARTLSHMLDRLPADAPVYLTIDIDFLDPAHAPGTGTPEPFGLTPWDGLQAITRLAPRIVALDVVETAAFDNGQTANVAGRLIREFLAERLVRGGHVA